MTSISISNNSSRCNWRRSQRLLLMDNEIFLGWTGYENLLGVLNPMP